jgi:hypothetical protein
MEKIAVSAESKMISIAVDCRPRHERLYLRDLVFRVCSGSGHWSRAEVAGWRKLAAKMAADREKATAARREKAALRRANR